MKRMGKVIGSGLFSLLLLLGLVLPMQTAVPVLQPMTVAANDITSHPAKGEVSGNGVYGYTTDYVCNGGPMQEEHAVQNGWHITAKNTYYAYGILWYQCWDTDDGDYYGWIDGNYLSFYVNNYYPASSPPPAVLQLRLRVFPLEKGKLPETVFMAMLPVMPAIQTGHRQHSTKSKIPGTSPQRTPVIPMA